MALKFLTPVSLESAGPYIGVIVQKMFASEMEKFYPGKSGSCCPVFLMLQVGTQNLWISALYCPVYV
jgi:hypothetical protein